MRQSLQYKLYRNNDLYDCAYESLYFTSIIAVKKTGAGMAYCSVLLQKKNKFCDNIFLEVCFLHFNTTLIDWGASST
jgi:hypothetical protein